MWLSKKCPSDEFSGFLDAGSSITGELHFSGTLRVDGSIHGSITTSDVLVVGEKALIHADIKAGEIEIHGSVSGNIRCERRLQICAGGHLRGDVRTPKLIIEEGGVFEGFTRAVMAPDQDQLQLIKANEEEPELGSEVTP